MIIRKLSILFLIVLFLPLTSYAQAEESLRYEEIDFDLKHDLSGSPGSTDINLLEKDGLKDIDTFPYRVKNADGLYWGNLFPASTIAMGQGFTLNTQTILEIPPEQIASGSSEFWMRIPVDGNTVSSFTLQLDGHNTQGGWPVASTNGLYYERQGDDPDTDTVKWTDRGVFINLIYPLSTAYSYALTTNGTEQGLSALYPNNYTFVFNLFDIEPLNDQVSLLFTEEIYGDSSIYLVKDGEEFRRNINASLAWSFVFLSGLPKAGLYSFPFVPVDSNIDLVTPGEPFYNYSYVTVEKEIPVEQVNNTHITLQIPFMGRSGWHVEMHLSGGATFKTVDVNLLELDITPKSDMITVSSPHAVNTSGLSGSILVKCLFSPDEPIRLLSAFDEQMRLNFGPDPDIYEKTFITRFRDFKTTGGNIEWVREFSVFCNIYTTTGAYAELTWVGQSAYVDFGWGKGFFYPGEMQLFFQISNQTTALWSGNVEVLYLLGQQETYELSAARINYLGGVDERDLDGNGFVGPIEQIIYAIKKMGRDLLSGITGVISTLWSYLKDALAIIGNFIINLIGKVIAFIREMVEFIGNILKGVLYVLPISLMLVSFKFTSNPTGFAAAVDDIGKEAERIRKAPRKKVEGVMIKRSEAKIKRADKARSRADVRKKRAETKIQSIEDKGGRL